MTDADAATTYTVAVPENKAGERLDKLLAESLPGLSRTRIKALIGAGLVATAKGEAPAGDPARRVKAGEAFRVTVPRAEPAEPKAQAIALDVVYEDDDIIVIDKPSGLVVHPAPGNPDRTLVNALIAHCGDSLSGVGGVMRPGIVHRLDKDTSGLMVVAKNDAAHKSLSEQIRERSLERAYYAVVWGVPSPVKGEMTGNIGRSSRNRKKMAVLPSGGKPALTRYEVVRAFGTLASLVRCRLASGRTHQIRVHMADRGHPVIGDPLYGRIGTGRMKGLAAPVRAYLSGFQRQALHAYLLGLTHPKSGTRLRFRSGLPKDIELLLEYLYEV